MSKFLKSVTNNTAFGFLLGVVIAFLFACAIDSDVLNWSRENGVALLTVLVSVSAALLTLFGIVYDVSRQDERREEERQAKLESARAVLPLVLSELSEISQNHINFELDRQENRKTERWTLLESSFQTIKECIEHSNGEPHHILLEITRAYQILSSRGHDMDIANRPREDVDRPWIPSDAHNIDEYEKYARIDTISQWASFRSIVFCLFDWSRDRPNRHDRDNIHRSTLTALKDLQYPVVNGKMMLNDPVYLRRLREFDKGHKFEFDDPQWILR